MPTATFNAVDDQWIQRVGNIYPPTGAVQRTTAATTVQCGHTFDGTTYYVQLVLLRFDTSSLPDTATITGATLRIFATDVTDVNSTQMTADWYAWDGVSDTDWTDTPGTNAHAGKSISSFTNAAYNNTTLINAGANVSTTGSTYLRLHGTGGQVTSFNDLQFAAIEHATEVEAQLIVTYTIPHVGYDLPVDETTGNAARVLNAVPTSTDYGLVVSRLEGKQPMVPCSFTTASGGIGGSTTEALATLTPVRDFTTGTAATAFTVPAGKTMRVTGFWGVARRDTGTGSITWELEMNLHVDTGATATTASPTVFSGVAAWKELAASTTLWIGTAPVWFEIPGGIELPAGASFAIGYRNSSSQPTRATNAISVIGYEF